MRTKIVATIGPSSKSFAIQEAMIRAGMDVARFNFSYGKNEEFEEWTKNIRKIAGNLDKNVAIMQDLQGPRIRLRNLSEPLEIKAGPEIKIGHSLDADLNIDGFNIIPFLKIGERLLINDGMIRMRIVKKEKGAIICQILTEGKILPNSSINFPDSNLHLPAFTDKDKADLKFGLGLGVDFVALSFVKTAKDILLLKRYVQKVSNKKILPKIIAKIETDEALKNIDGILDNSDGIMIARGDLGIQIGREIVPTMQKFLIKKALVLGKPTIVATQMLASMTEHPLPTRAEVSDVVNSALDGADAVMLSNETAVGEYPRESVREMQKILNSTHGDNLGLNLEEFRSEIDHLGLAACDLADKIGAKMILAVTKSGYTAKMVAKHRPKILIIALTPDENVAKELSLVWGIDAYVLPRFSDAEELLQKSVEFIKNKNIAKSNSKIILIAGHPADKPSLTNLIKAITI